jgi:hypothetical protein
MKTTFNKLKLSLGGKDKKIKLLTILESNGLDDAVWCFSALDGFDKQKRLFAVFCARQVQHLMKDEQSINAINVAEKFANGEATKEELKMAADAADAAYADAYAAYAAAAYSAAAYSAAAAAYSDAAAAAAAADADAYYVADAAYYAADAAYYAAADAYYDDARKAQEVELRRILKECTE